jgi:hypothetical protein
MAVECQAVHAGRCPTPQWSRPLARMRSPRLLTATFAALGSDHAINWLPSLASSPEIGDVAAG